MDDDLFCDALDLDDLTSCTEYDEYPQTEIICVRLDPPTTFGSRLVDRTKFRINAGTCLPYTVGNGALKLSIQKDLSILYNGKRY